MNESAPCPRKVAIVGGGRWARVYIDVLLRLVSPAVRVVVHSPSNVHGMRDWAATRGIAGRLEIGATWEAVADAEATIIVNAARDHESAALRSLASDIPTLVEKPVALSSEGARRIAALAAARQCRLGAAHVFLFASYVENFARRVQALGDPEFFEVEWADPESEVRHAETKQFDAGLFVPADCLPHVVPVLGKILRTFPEGCRGMSTSRGGACVDIELSAGTVPCRVRLERNASRRRRYFAARYGAETLALDAAVEPGTISWQGGNLSGATDWNSAPRPLARLLQAFLTWAAGGEPDSRLDFDAAVRSCRVIDQVAARYHSTLLPWLADRLSAPGEPDADVRYILSELVQGQGSLPREDLERRISLLMQRCAGPAGEELRQKLLHAPDAARLIRTITE